MPSLDGRIFIRDDHNNLIGHHKLKYVTAEKWDKTERADIITFLEQHLTEQTHNKPNIPPELESKLRTAATIYTLKEAIVEILDEYDFGILSLLEERISKLEEDD